MTLTPAAEVPHQDRTRGLTPLLPALVAEAIRRKDWSRRLLTAAEHAGEGQTFSVDGSVFVRPVQPATRAKDRSSELRVRVVAADEAMPRVRWQRRGLLNVTKVADIFAWQPSALACFDTVFIAFWLSHVPSARWEAFLSSLVPWLAPQGRILVVHEHVRQREKEQHVVRQQAGAAVLACLGQ